MVFFGLIGNLLCLLILKSEKTITAQTIFLLKSLAVADSVVLVIGIFLWVLPPMCEYFNTMQAYYKLYIKLTPLIWPSYQTAYTVTILLTLLVSANRYMMVCQHSNGFTKRKARGCVVGVVAFSILYNLPRFYEYETEYVCDGPDNPRQVYGHSRLGASVIYRVIYLHVLHLVVLLGGPIAVLTFLNTALIKALQQRRRRRSGLMLSASIKEDDSGVTRIVIVVVFVFIACNTPTFVDHLFWTAVGDDNVICGHWLYFYTAVADMCAMLNSSVNFLIYVMTSPGFRQQFVAKFCSSAERLHIEWMLMIRSSGPQTRTTEYRHSSIPRESDDVALKQHHNGTAGACGKFATTTEDDTASQDDTKAGAVDDSQEASESLLRKSEAEAFKDIINVDVHSV